MSKDPLDYLLGILLAIFVSAGLVVAIWDATLPADDMSALTSPIGVIFKGSFLALFIALAISAFTQHKE